MSELLPCPFCGSTDTEIVVGLDDEITTVGKVTCMDCGASSGWWGDKNTAIEKWNTRHYPAEVQQAVERMKPMKVINKWSQHGIEYGDCPTCICPVERKHWDDHQHCDRCGQALDWSNDE